MSKHCGTDPGGAWARTLGLISFHWKQIIFTIIWILYQINFSSFTYRCTKNDLDFILINIVSVMLSLFRFFFFISNLHVSVSSSQISSTEKTRKEAKSERGVSTLNLSWHQEYYWKFRKCPLKWNNSIFRIFRN